jgi:hypothetical protein
MISSLHLLAAHIQRFHDFLSHFIDDIAWDNKPGAVGNDPIYDQGDEIIVSNIRKAGVILVQPCIMPQLVSCNTLSSFQRRQSTHNTGPSC